MVNITEATSIPIQGAGLKVKKFNKFLPGEYSKLTNAEITKDNFIESRRRARLAIPDYSATYPFNETEFLGTLGKYAVVEGSGSVYAINSDNIIQMFNSSTLGISTGFSANQGAPGNNNPDGSVFKFAGFFRYNSRNYFITNLLETTNFGPGYEDNGNAGNRRQMVSRIRIHRSFITDDDTPRNFYVGDGNFTVSSFTHVDNTNHPSTRYNYNLQYCRTFTMHKDRLWVATDNIIYFSKATDPTVFTTPDGGFIRFPEQSIRQLISVKDTLYVLCTNAVYAIKYNSNPNDIDDLSVILISGNIGGDSGVVYEDSVFFAKINSLYQINGNAVSKVLDLDLIKDNTASNAANKFSRSYWKLTVFQNYIILLYVSERVYPDLNGKFAVPPASNASAHDKFVYEAYLNAAPYFTSVVTRENKLHQVSCFWLNMDTSSIHAFSHKDYFDSNTQYGSVHDIINIPVDNKDNRSQLLFKTLRYYTPDKDNFRDAKGQGAVYYIESNIQSNDTGYDEVWHNDRGKEFVIPEVAIRVEQYSPDDSEHLIKRFKSFLVEGQLPDESARVKFKFDGNSTFTDEFVLSRDGTELDEQPNSTRYGLNQKARSISIDISRPRTAFAPADVGFMFTPNFQIIDMLMMWTPTQRASTKSC